MGSNFAGVVVLAALAILVVGCTAPGKPIAAFTPDAEAAPPVDPKISSGTAQDAFREVVLEETEGNPGVNWPQGQQDRLIIQPECSVTPGWDASFLTTFQGKPVPGARVLVNYVEVGATDDAGRISFTVPYTREIKVEVVQGEMKGEIDLDLEEGFPG